MSYHSLNFRKKFSLFDAQWQPKVIAEMNDYQFKLVKLQGDFIWHDHQDSDETFIVVEGDLRIDFRDGAVHVSAGEMFVVPKGVEHKPFAENEVKLLLIEPRGVLNTGQEGGDRTADNDVWIWRRILADPEPHGEPHGRLPLMNGGSARALFGGTDAPLFGRRQRRARGPRLPVIAVTGFLGSGKTTLIRGLLDKPEGANTAVVVNEYGEVGIDNVLLRSSSDVTVLLGNGCLCCNVRTDLQETLRGLFADRARGAVPSFERVVIETSGLADPGPILQTFATDRGLGREFHLQTLISVVDALIGGRNIERIPEAKKQVALADRIVVTKSDLAEEATTAGLIEHLGALNAAPVGVAVEGEIEPSFLLAEAPSPRHSFDLGEAEHTHGLSSFALFFEEPLSWAAFEQTLAVLTALRGPDLLRVKGLVAIKECRGPVVVHFVQHIAHPPIELEDWPDNDRRSRLVFVTRGLPRETVARLFDSIAIIACSAQDPLARSE